MSALINSLLLAHPRCELRWDWYLLQLLCLVLPLNSFLSALLALGFVIFFVARHGLTCLDTPINRGWLLFGIILGLSVVTAYDVGNAALGLLNFYPFLLLFAIVTYLLKTCGQEAHILWLLILNSVPLSLFGIAQVIINRSDWKLPRLFNSYEIPLGFSEEERISSLFGHVNEFALYCLMLLPIILHFSLGKVVFQDYQIKEKLANRRTRILAAIVLGLLIAMLVLAQSRNVWGLAFAGLVMQSVLYSYWWLVGLLMVAVPSGLWWAASAGIGRTSWQNFISANEIRMTIWQFCSELVWERPFLGWGLRNFIDLREKYNFVYEYVVHEHSFFWAIALGSGMPALVLFMGLMGWMMASSLRSRQSNGIVASFAVILFLLSGIYDTSHYELRVFILFWLMAAIAQASAEQNDKIAPC